LVRMVGCQVSRERAAAGAAALYYRLGVEVPARFSVPGGKRSLCEEWSGYCTGKQRAEIAKREDAREQKDDGNGGLPTLRGKIDG
jgi:hypothetical protein